MLSCQWSPQKVTLCLDSVFSVKPASVSGLQKVSPLSSLLKLCSFFNSNAVPLKLSFQNLDPLGDHISVIFKVRFSAFRVSEHQVFAALMEPLLPRLSVRR